MKKWMLWLLVLMMTLSSALAEPAVVQQGLALGDGYVYYPQLEGMDDPALQETVNAALLESCGAEALLTRLALTMHSPTPLTTAYNVQQSGDVLSVALLASGPVESDRATQVWYTANIDLTTGQPIMLDDLFTDPDAARLALSDYLEWDLAPQLSAHLRAGQLTPLPEEFTLSPAGLTLHYPLEQLTTLSDKAGTVHLSWCEMLPHLNLAEGSLLDRMGALPMIALDESSAAAIRTQAENGMLPGIPARLGDSIPQLVEAHGLLIDPDLYENGRLFQLEGGAFRSVYLLSDSLTEGWDSSVVQGIRTDRGSFFGLMTGVTTQSEWHAILGQPDASVPVDEARAESNRIVPGSSDYYNLTGVQLRLHANEEGVLHSIFLIANE